MALRLFAMLCFAMLAQGPAFAGLAPVAPVEEAILHERYVDAFAMSTRALRLAFDTHGADHPETIDWAHRTGWIAHLSGEQVTAQALIERTLRFRQAQDPPQPVAVAESLYRLGLIAVYAQDGAESERILRNALRVLRTSDVGDTELEGAILQALASLRRWSEGLPIAIEGYREALEVRRRGSAGPTAGIADNLTWLGWCLFHAGNLSEALPVLLEAERELTRVGLQDHSNMGVSISARADMLMIEGKWAEAEALYGRSTAIFERSRERHFPGLSRRKSPPHGYVELAAAQLELGRPHEAWVSYQRYVSHVARDLTHLARWADLDPEGLGRVEHLRRRRAYLDPAAPGSWVESLELRAEIVTRESDYLKIEPPEPELTQLQRQLAPDQAYIELLFARVGDNHKRGPGPIYGATWVFVVRADAFHAIPLQSTTDLSEWTARDTLPGKMEILTLRAASWPLRIAPDSDLDDYARTTGRLFVDPILPYLDGVDSLVVEFTGKWPRVPFETIIGRDNRHVGDVYDVTYAPSAEIYTRLASKRGDVPGEATLRTLAVGDPDFRSGPAGGVTLPSFVDRGQLRRAMEHDPEALDKLPRLPHAGEELDHIATLFPSTTVLRGDAASETRMRVLSRSDALGSFDLIHFATHALINGLPERDALALTRPGRDASKDDNGLVEITEILDSWNLHAELVTLSACRSATPMYEDNGQYLGFTQALLGVGARRVLASMWAVDDQATALLMGRFYENIAGKRPETGEAFAPMGWARALRDARMWVREWRSPEGRQPFLHPVYWSGFVLTGPPD